MHIPGLIVKILILVVLLFIAKQLWEMNKKMVEQVPSTDKKPEVKAPLVVKVEEKVEGWGMKVQDFFGATRTGISGT